MTLQEAKNEVAKKYGYPKWSAFVYHEIHKHSTTAFWSFIEEATELYARSKWDEACTAQKAECDMYHFAQHSCNLNIMLSPKPEFKP
jgi:hypothetical protein